MEELRADDPQRVGRYTLLARLGSGGMGQVYFGRSLGGRHVAVKVVRADLARDRNFRLRFAREIETARRVSGAFTAPVIDADPDAPVPWLVTGYVNGPSLADAVERHGPLPVESVLTLAVRLAEGLSAVHEAGVVHRDLKPANVLLAEDGPRLIDFGISQAADFVQITLAGMSVGTPGFMSPEQILGDPVGPGSDIFTMGAVLAFAATGEQPFGTGSPDVRNQRVLHLAPRLDNLPGEVRPLVARCMVREPADRPTAIQFLDDLVAAHPEAADRVDWLPESVLAEVGQRIPVLRPAGETPSAEKAPAADAESLPSPEQSEQPAQPEQSPPEREKPEGETPAQSPLERETPAPDLGAERTRTSASTPPPGASGNRPRKPWARRRIWVIGATAAVAVAGTLIGLLVAPSAGPSAQSGRPADATRSAPSATSTAKTSPSATLPLADAAFNWEGYADSTETSSSDTYWKKAGTTWQDFWTLNSDCGVQACAAELTGTIDGLPFTAALARSGATYTGSTAMNNWFSCVKKTNFEKSTLSIKLTATSAGAPYGEWSVTTFTGTMIWNVPYDPDGGCTGSLYQMQVTGKQMS